MAILNVETMSNPNNTKFCGFKDATQWYACSPAVYEFISKKVPCQLSIEEQDGETITRVTIQKQTSVKEDNYLENKKAIIKQSSLNRAIETINFLFINNPEELAKIRTLKEIIEIVKAVSDEYTNYVLK